VSTAETPRAFKLYGYWRSSCSWRVRIALAYKGVPHEIQAVHLVKDGGEQHQEPYRQKNPMAQVPTLEFEQGGALRRVAQSLAILELLEEWFPAPRLLPEDPYLRGRTRQLAEMINAGIQPMQNLSLLQHLKRDLGVDEQAFARRFIHLGLTAFQAAAGELAGRFCVGSEVTLADACLVPQLYNARRFGVSLDELPLLTRIEAACMTLPAFQDAHADRQADAVVTPGA
jgi:maleylpyruvate isomerase